MAGAGVWGADLRKEWWWLWVDDLIIIGNSCSLDDITKYHHQYQQ